SRVTLIFASSGNEGPFPPARETLGCRAPQAHNLPNLPLQRLTRARRLSGARVLGEAFPTSCEMGGRVSLHRSWSGEPFHHRFACAGPLGSEFASRSAPFLGGAAQAGSRSQLGDGHCG